MDLWFFGRYENCALPFAIRFMRCVFFTWFYTFHCIFDWTKCWITVDWLTRLWWICIKCSVRMIWCNASQTTILLKFCQLFEICISTNCIHFASHTKKNLEFQQETRYFRMIHFTNVRIKRFFHYYCATILKEEIFKLKIIFLCWFRMAQ